MFIVVSYPPQVAYVDIAPGGGVIKHPYHHCTTLQSESTMVRIVEKKVETTGPGFITFPLRGNEHPGKKAEKKSKFLRIQIIIGSIIHEYNNYFDEIPG